METAIERVSAADGFEFDVYRSGARIKGRPAVIVLQEIFGVNSHIRGMADRLAACGFTSYAPALFDRQQKDVALGYGPADIEKGKAFLAGSDWDVSLQTVGAVVRYAGIHSAVSVMGYCWGGSLAYASGASHQEVAAVVGYYGGMWGKLIDLSPRCPTMMHFAEKDHSVPIAAALEYRRVHPCVAVHTYDAEHGFNCDQRNQYSPGAAQTAFDRSIGFLRAVL